MGGGEIFSFLVKVGGSVTQLFNIYEKLPFSDIKTATSYTDDIAFATRSGLKLRWPILGKKKESNFEPNMKEKIRTFCFLSICISYPIDIIGNILSCIVFVQIRDFLQCANTELQMAAWNLFSSLFRSLTCHVVNLTIICVLEKLEFFCGILSPKLILNT